MNTYTFITKSYVEHEVTVKAKSEDEAWDKFHDGEGQEEEIECSDSRPNEIKIYYKNYKEQK